MSSVLEGVGLPAEPRGPHAWGPTYPEAAPPGWSGSPGSALATRPSLEAVGICYSTPSGHVLLEEVTFALEPGMLVAVVGPTGAGK